MILLSLVACLEDADLAGNFDDLPTESQVDVELELRVDVLPSAIRDASDRLRVLPDTLAAVLPPGRDLDLDAIELGTPQEQDGTVTAYELNPTIGVLPGSPVPVSGTVFVGIPDTLQSYAAQLDQDGRFEAWVVAQREYRLQVVPDDPMLPMYDGPLHVGVRPTVQDLDLQAGAPIYGRVTSTAGPVPRARVVVETADGRRSAVATADDFGVYQIRVHPGTWTVVSLGRELNQDPEIRRRAVEVGEDGAVVDFDYPTDLQPVLAEGRVLTPDGSPIGGTAVRLRSLALDGFEDGEATWSAEVPVAGNGVFLAKVVPGHYALDVIPPPNSPRLGPTTLEVDLNAGSGPIGDVELGTVGRLRATVVDTAGTPLVDAQVTCTEVGFDQDAFTGFSNEEGLAVLELPAVELACDVVPPGDRPDLAPFRARIEPEGATSERRFDLSPGQQVSGTVEVDGVGEASAVVEIRGPDGGLLAFDVTDEDGTFDVRVDPRPYAPEP